MELMKQPIQKFLYNCNSRNSMFAKKLTILERNQLEKRTFRSANQKLVRFKKCECLGAQSSITNCSYWYFLVRFVVQAVDILVLPF